MTDPTAAPAAAPAPAPPIVPDPTAAPAPAAPAAPAAASPTIAAGGVGPAPVAARFPDDWRAQLAGDDQSFIKTLERYDSPTSFAKAHRELTAKLSSGELRASPKPLPDNATDEQRAAWRAERGLPANSEAYLSALKLDDGIVPGEADKPLLESFAKEAEAAGVDQQTFNKLSSWWFRTQDAAATQQAHEDARFHTQAVVELTQEWGKEFTGNNAAVSNLMQMMPESVRYDLLSARLPNGRMVGDDPEFNRAMLMIAKQINPAATLLPAAAGMGTDAVASKISEHEKNMRATPGTDAWRAYWMNDAAKSEYHNLLDARVKMGGPKAA